MRQGVGFGRRRLGGEDRCGGQQARRHQGNAQQERSGSTHRGLVRARR
ncbi:hypothetical protein D187_007456 [Cystobacter fuscus DSM 2262]|uniref:Uncharacterized protein n=1 Tax=Cystobacter fuscus (strain ATCC 25194 / DSM 2262 / NBRC 100088 / M29) TaxID=1242864 RepID=S9Q4A1_CYSF2|nr:hypothetical protein D187_007456 [Cystobacter fuscus DSM 2262]